jgi:Dyp-type peroxidase family
MTDQRTLPPAEPLLASGEIQGNVVPGFMKPYQTLLALDIHDVRRAKEWITALASRTTTLAESMRSRHHVRAAQRRRTTTKARALRGFTPNSPDEVTRTIGLDDVWLNVAVSYRALVKLVPSRRRADLDAFSDNAFRLGMAARSASLGDPTDPRAEGHPVNWVVGGAAEPDVLLIIAADRRGRLADRVRTELRGATRSGTHLVYQEASHKLDAIGTEHFGFQDGVSQPGVRGMFGTGPNDFITPRTVAPQHVPETWLYGLPGQYLVWPGEFVFGYPGHGSDPLIPGAVHLPGPDWSRNGSYLAFRRLRQDVGGFRGFLKREAGKLAGHGIDAERLAAYVVGRWPSGAPLPRAVAGDDPELGVDPHRNNYFEFGADAVNLALVGGGDTDSRYPTAAADPLGLVCPQFAHIRKVNTRTAANDAGGRMASFTRRILRRGLPYGPPYAEKPDADRGLLFLSYQSSLTDQFEFLLRRWMGNELSPRDPGGFDMFIGQNGRPGEHRRRHCTLAAAGVTLSAPADFVVPTGGGYFFAPSISALRDVLGGASPTS